MAGVAHFYNNTIFSVSGYSDITITSILFVQNITEPVFVSLPAPTGLPCLCSLGPENHENENDFIPKV